MADRASRVGGGLLGSGSLYAIATVAPVLVGLLITPLVTRALGATEYGTVGIGISLYQTGAILLGLGLSAAITRHAIVGASGVSGAVALVYFGVAMALALATVGVLTIPLWSEAITGSAGYVMAAPITSAFGLSALTLSQSVFRAENRVTTFVALGITSALLGPSTGLLLISIVDRSADAYLAGLALGHVSTAVASLLFLPRAPRSVFSRRLLWENLRIGLPTVPHSVAAAFLTTITVVLASNLNGVADAGRMQLALFLGTAPLMVLAAFNNSWAPMIYRASDEQRPRLLSRSTQAIAVLVFVLVGGFCVLVDPVARFIAGPEVYSTQLVQVALIAATSTPFMALYLVNINAVFLSGKTGPLALTTPLSAAIALLVVLVARSSLTDSLIAFGVAIPLFHLAMWGMSTLLRARTGYPAASIGASLPGFAAAALAPAVMLLVSPPLWASLIGFVAVAGGFIVANRAAIAEFR